MLLGTRLGYGVRALYELALSPERRSAVRDLAQRCGTTEAVLRRILLDLRAAGYLEAQKGRLGGFRLIQEPQAIKIVEVAKVLERQPALILGGTRRDLLSVDPACPTYPFWQSLEEKFLGELSQATLADVIALAGPVEQAPPRGRPQAKRARRTARKTRSKGRTRRSGR